MKVHKIAANLLPVCSKEYTRIWAMSTYKDRSAFYLAPVSESPSDQDLDEWIRTGRDLCEDLKRLGLSKGKKKIVSLMNNFFGETNENNAPFQNINEVIDWFCKRENYHKNYEKTMNMLHMFQYGIFRNGNNTWALDEAKSWMEGRSIEYKEKTGPTYRQGKGFVYRLIVSRASNTICTRFQTLTQRHYQEYVIVRDKSKYTDVPGQVIEKCLFNHCYKGYIVRLNNETSSNTKMLTNEQFHYINNLVKKSVEYGTTYGELKRMLETSIQKAKEGTYITLSELIFVCF